MPTAKLHLPGGWSGRVLLRDSQNGTIDLAQWHAGLTTMPDFLRRADHVYKQDGAQWVVAARLALGDRLQPIVAKHHVTCGGFSGLLRRLLPSRAVQNFETACRLMRRGVPVTWPLAALERIDTSGHQESVFVTEQIPDAVDLHAWVQQWAGGQRHPTFATRRMLARRLGELFALLEQAGLWHRDAKAGNFLVADGPDGPQVYLVDLDGVRPALAWRGRTIHRGMAKLAATLLWAGPITATDGLRALRAYAGTRGRKETPDKALLYSLWRRAIAERLATFLLAARDAAATAGDT